MMAGTIPKDDTEAIEIFDRFGILFDKQHILREFVAGGCAGSIGIFIGFPFDTVKVRLQAHPTKYKTAMDCLRQCIRDEGFKGLYHGCLPPILVQGMINSLLFFGESTAMHLLQPELKHGQMGTSFNTVLAGMVGGVLQCTLLVPSDVIKCTMQAEGDLAAAASKAGVGLGKPPIQQENAFVKTWKCVKHVYRTEGFKGFYKGFGATIARECPSIGGYFFSYKSLKEMFRKLEKRETPSTASILVSGGVAGAISWTVVYPFDVIKTNMQIAPLKSAANIGNGEITMASMTSHLYKTYGAKIFFRGLGTTVLRAIPVNASTFYFYELFKAKMHLEHL